MLILWIVIGMLFFCTVMYLLLQVMQFFQIRKIRKGLEIMFRGKSFDDIYDFANNIRAKDSDIGNNQKYIYYPKQNDDQI